MLGIKEKDGKFIFTISREKYDRLVRFDNRTGNGVVYEDELAGSSGCDFYLVREKHHTDEDIEKAKDWLRGRRDIVGMYICYPEWELDEED